MKQFILFSVLFISCTLKAQLPACSWGFVPQGANVFQTIHDVISDNKGNVITVGNVAGKCDLNPSNNPQDTFYTKTGYNYYMTKTSPSGKLLWVKLFQKVGTALFNPFLFKKIMVDKNNDIVLCVSFSGSFDFGSGGVIKSLTSHFPTYDDMGVCKYDENGNYKWAFSIGDNSLNTVTAHSMALLSNNTIVIGFYSNSSVDMDPGTGVQNSVNGGTSLVYYSTDGNYINQTKLPTVFSYAIDNKSIGVDGADNNYIISIGYNETTITKVNSAGVTQWAKKMGDFQSFARVEANAIYVASSGDFYLHGTYSDTVDFDLGTGIVNKISSMNLNNPDIFLAKYNSNGDLQWVKTFLSNLSLGTGLLSASGSVFMVGNIKGNVALNNGISVNSLSPLVTNGFVAEFNSSGNCTWATSLTDTITLKFGFPLNANQYVLSGNIRGTQDIDPTASKYPLSADFNSDFTAIYGVSGTGIHGINRGNSYLIYPNPSRGDCIKIQSGTAIQNIKIFDENGKLVDERIEENTYAEELKINLPEGIYFIKINDEGGSKFIVD